MTLQSIGFEKEKKIRAKFQLEFVRGFFFSFGMKTKPKFDLRKFVRISKFESESTVYEIRNLNTESIVLRSLHSFGA